MKNPYTSLRILAVVLVLFALVPKFSMAQTYATLPYFTGFESGTLDASWSITSSQAGVNIEVIETETLFYGTDTARSHSGSYFLGMDYGAGGTYNLNKADLHLNTTGAAGVHLQFWWAEWNDETEVEDGIYISDNGGVSFVKILDLNGASYTDLTWTHFNLSLDSINTLYSLSYTANFIVRFQQYDNYYFAGGNDGFLFDDIEVAVPCLATSGNISPVECNSYTVPSGNATYTVSGIYADTIPNTAGCDSIIAIDLTILATSSSIYESACNSYTVPSGNATYTVSGIYSDTIPNTAGCDSIISIDLTINASSSSSITETAMDTYTSPSGAIYTITGIYTDTIPNAAGCDSVITIDLTVMHTGFYESYIDLIHVYPNPTSNRLFVAGLQHLQGIEQILVLDIHGRIVGEMEIGTNEISVSTLELGVYYLTVQHDKGTSRILFVKQ